MSATPDPSRAVTVPVPLTDIEAQLDRFDSAVLPRVEVVALCAALRIAVEGLERIAVPLADGRQAAATAALAAVRELVDLGEKP